MNISILPPSINQSGYSFLVEKSSGTIQPGAIKGVGVAG